MDYRKTKRIFEDSGTVDPRMSYHVELEVLENIANPFKILEGGDEETGMAQIAVQDYLKLIPTVKHSPWGYLWSSYDFEADSATAPGCKKSLSGTIRLFNAVSMTKLPIRVYKINRVV